MFARIALGALLLLANPVSANIDDPYFRIDEVIVRTKTALKPPSQPDQPWPPLPPPVPFPTDPSGSIISIGRQLWDIVVANNATNNYQDMAMSALPEGAKSPRDLSRWNRPHYVNQEVLYRNGLGMDVVKMKYKVLYTPGGRYQGKGRYLANVSIHPGETYVRWGFHFGAQVQIADPVNVGTDEDPIAGAQVSLNWTVKPSVGSVQQGREIYFVQGDGQWSRATFH